MALITLHHLGNTTMENPIQSFAKLSPAKEEMRGMISEQDFPCSYPEPLLTF